jgi:hypothetical protein
MIIDLYDRAKIPSLASMHVDQRGVVEKWKCEVVNIQSSL